jgi:hypothetical protein
MLTALMRVLERRRQGGLTLSEIGREMGAQPSAILPMIELLVKKGRLIELGPDGGFCGNCRLQSDCTLLAARGSRYLVNRGMGSAHDKLL